MNLSCFEELEHLKLEMTKLQRVLIINRTSLNVFVDAHIVLFIVIVLGVNGP